MFIRKLLSIVLIILLSVTSLFSCIEEADNTNESTADTSSDVSGEEIEEYDVLDVNFNNETLTILGKRDNAHYYSRQQWEYNPDISGEIINDVVFNRNVWLENTYGIKLKYATATLGNDYFILDTVVNQVQSGSSDYDIVVDGLTTMCALAEEGHLYNLDGLSENLDLSKPWWDQRVNESLSIMDKIYFAAGDILITDDEYTYCVLYNKDLFDNNDLASLIDERDMYQLVKDGDWTYDLMYTMAKQSAASIDGDDVMSYDDVWGVIADIGCFQVLMAGAGYNTTSKDINDLPSLDVVNDYSTTLFEKLADYLNDKNTVLFSDYIDDPSPYKVANEIFVEGRSLFYITKISAVNNLRESDINFGVIPIPKYNSEQSQYYNSAASLHFTPLGIPISSQKVEMACIALEALGYQGMKNLTPAYIETTLKLKRLQRSDDSEMIDLILDTRCFDLGVIYNWGGLNAFFNKFAGTEKTDFVSSWDSVSGAAEIEINDTIESFIAAAEN